MGTGPSIVIVSAFALALGPIALAQAPATSQPTGAAPVAPAADAGYHLAPGPYEVGSVGRLVLRDPSRNKDLEVVVRYPKARAPGSAASGGATAGTPWRPDEKFPLVVFSHGMGGGGPSTFPELTAHWASWGYVVVLPTHSDSMRLRWQEGKDVKNARRDPAGALATVDLADRVADVKFILDSIPTIEAKIPELQLPAPPNADAKPASDRSAPGAVPGRIDRERLAMAGHSAGAFTTQLAVGVKARGKRITGRPALELTDIGDPRFKAGVIISGQGTVGLALTKDSWNDVTRPTLAITGSLDTVSVSNQTPQSRREPFTLSRGRAKGGPAAYLLYIEGATHGSYAGKATANALGEHPTTPIKTITDATSASTLAFLDAYVKDDARAKAWLDSKAIEGLDAKNVKWEWK